MFAEFELLPLGFEWNDEGTVLRAALPAPVARELAQAVAVVPYREGDMWGLLYCTQHQYDLWLEAVIPRVEEGTRVKRLLNLVVHQPEVDEKGRLWLPAGAAAFAGITGPARMCRVCDNAIFLVAAEP